VDNKNEGKERKVAKYIIEKKGYIRKVI